MKRLIILLVLGAVVFTLLSPPVCSLAWDPRNPPKYPDRPTLIAQPVADDHPWIDVEKSQDTPVVVRDARRITWIDWIKIGFYLLITPTVDVTATDPPGSDTHAEVVDVSAN